MLKLFKVSQCALVLGLLLIPFSLVAQAPEEKKVESVSEQNIQQQNVVKEEITAEEVKSKADTRLQPIVVTASGFQQEIKEAPASITVITRQDLESQAAHNLGEALENVEGIDVTRGGKAGGMNISIRGLPSDYTLILIDGKRLNQSSGAVRPNGFGDVDTNFIPPLNAIERIEVVRGPMSTLYGSDAMGGVINIITRKVADEFMGSVRLGGTYQFNDDFAHNAGTNIYLSGPIKKDLVGFALRGSLFHRGEADVRYIDKNGTESKLGFSGLNREDDFSIGGRLTFTPNQDHDFIIDLDRAYQRFDNRKGELGTLNGTIAPGRAGGGYADHLTFDRDRYSLTHNGRWGFASSETSVLYDTTETVGRLNPVTAPVKPVNGTPRDIKYDNINIESKWVAPLFNDRHLLSVGGSFWKQRFKDTLDENPQHFFDQYQWAVFAEDEWRIINNLALTLGARYDDNEKFGGEWSPRAYLVWNALPQWTFKGGISRGYKTPRINQMVDGIIGFGSQGTLPLLGNANLKPETSTTSEVGIIYDNERGLNLNATFFYTDFKDKIDAVTHPNCRAQGGNVVGCIDIGDWIDRNGNTIESFSKPVNIGKVKLRGVELGTRIMFGETWTVTGNYTYTDSEQKTGAASGRPLGSEPRHMVNAKINWKALENLNLWTSGEYRNKQYRGLAPNGSEVFYKSYTLLNLGATYAMNKNTTFALALYNATDKDFVDYGDNPLSPAATTYSNAYYQVLEGRRLWVSVDITF
ncbi:MAG: TonB-dependent receptor [Burkholderiales bacterium]|nr:TonB-dependent receptor [Burkholderiales bacterium]